MNNTNTKSLESIWKEQLSTYDYEPDLAYAKSTFFKQSNESVSAAFSRSVIERSNELRVMPNELFNSYFHFFIDFLIKTEHQSFDAPEVASCFTSLLKEKLDSNSIVNSELLDLSKGAVNYLTRNIDFFNEDTDIFGNLEEKLKALKGQLNTYQI